MNVSVSYQNHLYPGTYGQQPLQMAPTLYQQPLAMQEVNHAKELECQIRGVELDNSVTLQQDAVSVGGNLNVLAFAAMLGDEDINVAWDDSHEAN